VAVVDEGMRRVMVAPDLASGLDEHTALGGEQQDSMAGTPSEEALPSGGDRGSCCSMGETEQMLGEKKNKPVHNFAVAGG
jgi:hypothetical protein